MFVSCCTQQWPEFKGSEYSGINPVPQADFAEIATHRNITLYLFKQASVLKNKNAASRAAFYQGSGHQAFGNIVRTDLADFGDFLVGQQPEGELVQIRVMSQGDQEGASDFTVTQFIVLQGGWGTPSRSANLGRFQAHRFADLTDLLPTVTIFEFMCSILRSAD